jgi:hypothetical protein
MYSRQSCPTLNSLNYERDIAPYTLLEEVSVILLSAVVVKLEADRY